MRKFIAYLFVSSLLLSISSLSAACLVSSAETTPLKHFTDLSVDQNTQVIEDYKTGLMWARCFMGSSWNIGTNKCEVNGEVEINWKSALSAAVTANDEAYLGFADWRVPNVKELASIAERKCHIPSINSALFPLNGLAAKANFWTNTPVFGGGGRSVRLINFGTGQMVSKDYTTKHYLRLVRDVSPP